MNNLVVHNLVCIIGIHRYCGLARMLTGSTCRVQGCDTGGGKGGIGGIIGISIYRLSKYTVAPARVSSINNSVNDTGNGAPGASSLSMC